LLQRLTSDATGLNHGVSTPASTKKLALDEASLTGSKHSRNLKADDARLLSGHTLLAPPLRESGQSDQGGGVGIGTVTGNGRGELPFAGIRVLTLLPFDSSDSSGCSGFSPKLSSNLCFPLTEDSCCR